MPLTFTNQNEPTPPPVTPPPEPDPEPEPDPTPPVEDDEEESDCKIAGFVVKVANKVADFWGRSTKLKAVRPKTQDVGAAKQDLVMPQIISNRIDGAVARIDQDISYTTNYLTYSTGVKGVKELAGVGTSVHKLGRS